MHKRNKKINKKNSPRRTLSLLNLTTKARINFATNGHESTLIIYCHEKAQKTQRKIRRRFRGLTQIGRILFLPADADLAAAFSIPVSVKPAAGARWAIRDGPHKNMQAGKNGV